MSDPENDWWDDQSEAVGSGGCSWAATIAMGVVIVALLALYVLVPYVRG